MLFATCMVNKDEYKNDLHTCRLERLVDPSQNMTVLSQTNRSDVPTQEWLDLQASAEIILVPTHYTNATVGITHNYYR